MLSDLRKKAKKSGKNPTFYNQQIARLVKDLANHSNSAVRLAFASSEHAKVTELKNLLRVEENIDVLRAALWNKNTPIGTILFFAEDNARVKSLGNIDDLIAHLEARIDDVE